MVTVPHPAPPRHAAIMARSILVALCVAGDLLAGLLVLSGSAAWGWLMHLAMLGGWAGAWHAAPTSETVAAAGTVAERLRAWARGRSTWFWASSVLVLCSAPGLAMPALLAALGLASVMAPRRLQMPEGHKRVPGARVGRAPRARRSTEPRRVAPESLLLRPLQDVVRRGDALAKQRSALYLSTVMDQAPAPLLDVLLADPDLDVRSAAAVAVSRLEMANGRALQQANEQTAAAPSDPQAHLHLAEAYRIYAFNAVTSDTQRQFLLGRAMAALHEGLQAAPDNAALLLCAADTAWAGGDAALARNHVNRLLQQDACPPAALELLADIALNCHDYSLLEQARQAASEQGPGHAG